MSEIKANRQMQFSDQRFREKAGMCALYFVMGLVGFLVFTYFDYQFRASENGYSIERINE